MINLNMISKTFKVGYNINKKLWGVNTDIFYPKGGFSKSGNLDDIIYDLIPDDIQVLVIPSVFKEKFINTAGITSEFYEITEIYVPANIKVYKFMKLVAHFHNKLYKYKVTDIMTTEDDKGQPIYYKLLLEPISELLITDEETINNNNDFNYDLIDNDVNIDNSISKGTSKIITKEVFS